jgi:lipoate-protein ligase A
MLMPNFARASWRLIHTPPASGAWNMAVDEAILETAGSGETLPTLRLYAWQPACLSLGYAQPVADVDQAALSANGWDLVRRPTGGRAILHTDELTYSVCGSQDEPRLQGGVLASYRVLAQALLRALKLLNIPAQAREKPTETASLIPGQPQNPVCFEVPSNYEVTVQGKKLIGSAQARRREGVLQHGSLPLLGDLTRITQALVFPDDRARAEAARRLLEHACTAEQVSGAPLDWQVAAQAFAQAFAETLNLELIPAQLTAGELERAEALVREKYANPSWVEKL